MTNTRRWPPGPWIEPVRIAGSGQWDYKKDCVVCGQYKQVWYFRHTGQRSQAFIPVTADSLCKECGDAAYQMQQMDRLVNE